MRLDILLVEVTEVGGHGGPVVFLSRSAARFIIKTLKDIFRAGFAGGCFCLVLASRVEIPLELAQEIIDDS